jgi:hypothetical protein
MWALKMVSEVEMKKGSNSQANECEVSLSLAEMSDDILANIVAYTRPQDLSTLAGTNRRINLLVREEQKKRLMLPAIDGFKHFLEERDKRFETKIHQRVIFELTQLVIYHNIKISLKHLLFFDEDGKPNISLTTLMERHFSIDAGVQYTPYRLDLIARIMQALYNDVQDNNRPLTKFPTPKDRASYRKAAPSRLQKKWGKTDFTYEIVAVSALLGLNLTLYTLRLDLLHAGYDGSLHNYLKKQNGGPWVKIIYGITSYLTAMLSLGAFYIPIKKLEVVNTQSARTQYDNFIEQLAADYESRNPKFFYFRSFKPLHVNTLIRMVDTLAIAQLVHQCIYDLPAVVPIAHYSILKDTELNPINDCCGVSRPLWLTSNVIGIFITTLVWYDMHSSSDYHEFDGMANSEFSSYNREIPAAAVGGLAGLGFIGASYIVLEKLPEAVSVVTRTASYYHSTISNATSSATRSMRNWLWGTESQHESGLLTSDDDIEAGAGRTQVTSPSLCRH